MKTKRRAEGWLLIDHRATQFLGGEVPKTGAFFESPTITCAHCGTIVILNPDRSRPRGHCRRCDAYVCDSAACNNDCNPLSAQLDAAEETIRNKQPSRGE